MKVKNHYDFMMVGISALNRMYPDDYYAEPNSKRRKQMQKRLDRQTLGVSNCLAFAARLFE